MGHWKVEERISCSDWKCYLREVVQLTLEFIHTLNFIRETEMNKDHVFQFPLLSSPLPLLAPLSTSCLVGSVVLDGPLQRLTSISGASQHP